MALLTKYGDIEGARLWDENMMDSIGVTGWPIPRKAFVIQLEDKSQLELTKEAIQNILETIDSESTTVQ